MLGVFTGFLAGPYHFTIEFFGFVVALGASFLVVTERDLIPGSLPNRVAAALGFGVLALVSALHGASFVVHDGGHVIVVLRTLGLLLIFVGLVGSTPGTAARSVAGIPLLLGPPGAALLMAAGAFMRARTERFYVRLALGGLAMAGAEVVVAQLPAAGAGLASSIGHLLRLTGYAAVLWWLWTVVKSSLQWRFVWAFAGLLAVVVLVVSATMMAIISRDIEREELDRTETQLRSAVAQIHGHEESLHRLVRLITDSEVVRDAVSSQTNLDRLAHSFTSGGLIPADFVLFTTSRGRPVARAGQGPFLDGERRKFGQTEALAVLGSSVITDEIVAARADIAVSLDIAGAPVVVAAGRIANPNDPGLTSGVVAVGRYLDSLTIEELSGSLGVEASLFISRQLVASELPAGIAEDLMISELPEPGETVTRSQTAGDRSVYSAFQALESEAGPVILALSSRGNPVTQAGLDVARGLFLVTITIGAIVLLLAWFLGRRLTLPIRRLTAAARTVRAGNLEATAPVAGEDEVGEISETFNVMTSTLTEMSDELRSAVVEEHAMRGRIETIIQSMADGLVAVNKAGRVVAFNPEAELLTGIAARDAIGAYIEEVLDVRDEHDAPAQLPIHSLEEGASTGIFIARRRGAPVPVSVTCGVIRIDDEIAGGVAVIRDMTRERQLDKVKGQFLSNISHELRTPLTPIKGYAEMLYKRPLSEDRAKKFAHGILESADRLERIVSLLVDYASMEAGRLVPKATSIDLGQMATGVAEEWGRRAPRHTLAAQIDESVAEITGDERLLRRSLDEVVDNAIKFSPSGGSVTMTVGTGPAGMVELVVSDEGIGISSDEADRVLGEFSQADGSDTRTYGGLGLGLALVRRVVEAHRGEVLIAERPQGGTRVTILLPEASSSSEGD